MTEEKIIIVGHKNPDLDSIASAIAYAKLKELLGENHWEARRAGALDKETIFVLERFGIKPPEVIASISDKKVALVDHCTQCQMVDGVNNAEVLEVVDHHNIGDLETDKPIRFHVEPVGSTCTIIASYYLSHDVEIPEKIAGVLLAGIISDTDLFKSPTTTEMDLKFKNKLEKISGVNSQELGIEMFKVKSELDKKDTKGLILEDFKEYELKTGDKLGVGQVKTMTSEEFLKERRKEIIKKMKEVKKEEKYDLLIFIITDLLKEGSELFAVGKKELLEHALSVELENNSVWVKDLMSRKKQIIPQLMAIKD